MSHVINTSKSDLYIINDYLFKDDADVLMHHIQNDLKNTFIINPQGKLFGKPITFHRSMAFYTNSNIEGYKFSGKRLPITKLSQPLNNLLNKVNEDFNTKFNAILINIYNDGDDYISAHSDDEKELDTTHVIGISLGSSRIFRVKNKNKKEVLDFPTKHGQLICMAGEFQSEFTHEIPKSKEHGVRISLTFRKHET